MILSFGFEASPTAAGLVRDSFRIVREMGSGIVAEFCTSCVARYSDPSRDFWYAAIGAPSLAATRDRATESVLLYDTASVPTNISAANTEMQAMLPSTVARS
jgi:hypothetical protein